MLIRSPNILKYEIKDFHANNKIYVYNNKIIRIGNFDRCLHIYKKLKVLYKFLSIHKTIPIPQNIIIGQTKIDGKVRPFLMYNFVNGIPGNKIKNEEKYKKIAYLISKIHNLPIRKLKKELIKRRLIKNYSWINFLKHNYERSLNILEKNKVLSEKKYDELKSKFKELISKNIDNLVFDREHLIHGDVYPGNFIFNKSCRKIIAVIDWDFFCFGDPAWEFGNFSFPFNSKKILLLKEYINIKKKIDRNFDEKSFILRARIYYPFIQLNIAKSFLNCKKSEVSLRIEKIINFLDKII